MKLTTKQNFFLGAASRYAMLIAVGIVFFVPIAFILSGSFKVNESIYSNPYKWLPVTPGFDNYEYILKEFGILSYIKNSLIVTVCTTALQCMVCALAGYGFGKLKFPGSDKLFLLCTATMMIPTTCLIIPMFLMMNKIGWVNTFLPLIIPAALTYTYGVFLFRQFVKSVPDELEEAALIDGAGSLRIFFSIILPLVKPAFVTVAILGALGSWNDYMGPLIYLNDQSKYTAQLALGFFSGQFVSDYHLLLAAIFLTILPVIVLYLFTQKYFIQSVASSGLKG